MGALLVKALLLGVYIHAPDFLKLSNELGLLLVFGECSFPRGSTYFYRIHVGLKVLSM